MNNILFCTSLVTEGTLMDDYSAGALGFYDLETLALTSNVSGKDFGIVGTSLLDKAASVINIPDIHLLNVVSASIPLNVSYSITIGAAELEEESTDTSDVELIILHKNAAPNGDWRQFITIPYADFNGDTDTLLDIITAKLEDLSKKGKLEDVTIDTTNGLKLYISNTEQYEVITKSELLTISDPSGYKPVVVPAKLIDLIDKNTASWGIWHREEDDDWYKAVGAKVVVDEYDTIISIQYTNLRKAGVTHDGPILRTLHIITTEETASAISAVLGDNNGGYPEDSLEMTIASKHGSITVNNKNSIVIQNGTKYYLWTAISESAYYTTKPLPTSEDTLYYFSGITMNKCKDCSITNVTPVNS